MSASAIPPSSADRKSRKSRKSGKSGKSGKSSSKASSSSSKKHSHKSSSSQKVKRPHRVVVEAKVAEEPASGFGGAPKIAEDEITLVEQKGAGCFGTVWAGKCRGANVAIKIPKNQEGLTEKKIQEFVKEVEIMSKIFHPNVTLFMGACLEPGKVMIVTELLQNNVEELLRSTIPLSLTDRIRMARDAARGMAWLHGSNPKIIHRDLKTSNLLFVEHEGTYTIKVCDFGLSQLLEGDDSQDKKNAIGSPLWMAPEVMQKKPFNERADVYSFGIMLWEFYTRKAPFPHHRDFEEFKQAVAVKDERPEIPPECEASLVSLMKKCWHKDPDRRPPFPRVAKYLEKIMVDVAINDEVGRKFWKDNMIEDEAVDNPIEVVEWDDFLVFFAGFLQPLGTPLSDTATLDEIRKATLNQLNEFQQRSETHARRVAEAFRAYEDREWEWEDPKQLMKHIDWKCLHAVLHETTKDGREIVRMTKFGEILHWFGPLERSPNGPHEEGGFLARLREVLSCPWFHGSLSGQKASKLLLDKEAGTFMVRFSSQPGSFAVSRVTRAKQINHVRVLHEGNEYKLEGSASTSPTLPAVIKGASEKLFLETPCPGNQYSHLFVSADVANTVGEQNYLYCDD